MSKILDQLRAAFEAQVRLEQQRIDGLDASGRDAVRSMKMLHWSGDHLAGELLPQAVNQTNRCG